MLNLAAAYINVERRSDGIIAAFDAFRQDFAMG